MFAEYGVWSDSKNYSYPSLSKKSRCRDSKKSLVIFPIYIAIYGKVHKTNFTSLFSVAFQVKLCCFSTVSWSEISA